MWKFFPSTHKLTIELLEDIDVLIIALYTFTEIERQSLLSCLQIDVKRVHGTRGTCMYMIAVNAVYR